MRTSACNEGNQPWQQGDDLVVMIIGNNIKVRKTCDNWKFNRVPYLQDDVNSFYGYQ